MVLLGARTVIVAHEALVAVQGLHPGREYLYVPLADGGALAPPSAFHTDDPTVPYTFLVLGDSGSGDPEQYAISSLMAAEPADLIVHTGDPAAATLTAPANGATNVPVRPTFIWTAAAGAADYLLEVDDSPGFASPVYSTTVTGTSHTPGTDLPSNTQLYWRVTANNPCGSTVSTVFSFVTEPLPGDNERTTLVRMHQQRVELIGDMLRVERPIAVLAPSEAGAVVAADVSLLRQPFLDGTPRRGQSDGGRFEHHGR